MSEHARRQVLAKVAELAGPVVELDVVPLHDSARMRTPLALVTWQTDDVATTRLRTMGAPLMQEHTLVVAFVLRMKGGSDVLDAAVEAKTALAEAALSHERLNGLVTSWKLTGTQRDIDVAGEQPVIQNTLLFQASYKTKANDPTVIIA